MDDASMMDLIGWSWDSTPHPLLGEDDRVLRGGDGAARWVCDRSVHTELGRWSRASLEWELRYTTQPAQTASEAGVDLSLLAQRPTHGEMVTKELVRRFARPGLFDPIVAGLTRVELQDQILSLAHDGQLDVALGLVRDAVGNHPDDVQLRNMLAFCLIPVDPRESLQHLSRLCAGPDLSAALIAANTAAAELRLGRPEAVLHLADELASVLKPTEEKPLLWSASQLVDLSALPRRVEHTTITH